MSDSVSKVKYVVVNSPGFTKPQRFLYYSWQHDKLKNGSRDSTEQSIDVTLTQVAQVAPAY